jgi:hypothetical protein
MKDFDQILAESLDQIADGACNVDECLARHPEHAPQLKPLLQTAARMQRGGHAVKPSSDFRVRARAGLTSHMLAHPRHVRVKSASLRFAVSLAILALALVTTGTAFAQNALPGESLYGWKRTSEKVWQAVSIDPVGTDLALSQRRALELTRVMQDPDRSLRATTDYQETLKRLESRGGAAAQTRIYPALKGQQEMFKSSGLSMPDLDDYLSGISVTPADQATDAAPPKESGESSTPTAGQLPELQGGGELPTPNASPVPPNSVAPIIPILPTVVHTLVP